MARRVVFGFRVDHVVSGKLRPFDCRDCIYERTEAASVRQLRRWQADGATERTAQWEEAARCLSLSGA